MSTSTPSRHNDHETKAEDNRLRKITRSSIPSFGLSALFLASAFAPPNIHARTRTYTPPFVFRFGFSAIFAGAGYVLAAGDSRNGSGIATSWSLSFLILEQFSRGLKKSTRLPRSTLSIALSGATAATAAFYGIEYLSSDDME